MIPQRRLGRSGLSVSAIGLGCWAIGGPWTFVDHPAGWGYVDDRESERAIHYALDAGVAFFDTAANYGCGHSERILGRALAQKRDHVVVATKFGYNVDEDRKVVTRSDPDPARVPIECEASLRRLGTDYIDLYQLHVGDYPLESIPPLLEALESLVSGGKIRWYGWSTDNVEGARRFAQGTHATAVQHFINVANDAPAMLALCDELQLASVNRTPLGGGLLTGKFTQGTKFPADDVRSGWDLQEGRLADRLKRVEAERQAFSGGKRTLTQIALGWLLARSERTIPIPGFKTVEQVRDSTGVLSQGPLSPDEMMVLDHVFGR